MFEWMPHGLRRSRVQNGFEGGFFVTFVPVSVDDRAVHELIAGSVEFRSQLEGHLLRVDRVALGVQLVWNLGTQDFSSIAGISEMARELGEELIRVFERPLAA